MDCSNISQYYQIDTEQLINRKALVSSSDFQFPVQVDLPCDNQQTLLLYTGDSC